MADKARATESDNLGLGKSAFFEQGRFLLYGNIDWYVVGGWGQWMDEGKREGGEQTGRQAGRQAGRQDINTKTLNSSVKGIVQTCAFTKETTTKPHDAC